MATENVTDTLAKIKRTHIIKAMRERDRIGKAEFRKLYKFGPAQAYFLLDEGRRYDSKAIVGVAAKFIPGSSGPLTAADIYGGKQMKTLLEKLGFQVSVERLGTLTLPTDVADAEEFHPNNLSDARDRVRRTIVQRRGQKKFRDALLTEYGNRCAITGCRSVDVLEAAHIMPYLGLKTNHVTNGLLLRADIHTLFDLGLIMISPIDCKIEIDKSITDKEYRKFHGKSLRSPANAANSPNLEALLSRFDDESP